MKVLVIAPAEVMEITIVLLYCDWPLFFLHVFAAQGRLCACPPAFASVHANHMPPWNPAIINVLKPQKLQKFIGLFWVWHGVALAIWHGLSPVSVFFAFFFVELKCDTCTILFSQPTCVRVDRRTPFALVPLDAARTDFPSFVIGTIRSSEWNVKIALYHSNWSVPGALVGEITDSVKHSDSTAMIQFQSFTAVQYYWLVQLIHPGCPGNLKEVAPSIAAPAPPFSTS